MSLIADSCYTITEMRAWPLPWLWVSDRTDMKRNKEEVQILYVENFNSQEKNTGQQLHHRHFGPQLVVMVWEKPGCHIWGMPNSTMDTLSPTLLGSKNSHLRERSQSTAQDRLLKFSKTWKINTCLFLCHHKPSLLAQKLVRALKSCWNFMYSFIY